MTRFLRGLTALALLALVLVGAPWLLVRVGRLDAIARVPWTHLLTTPDNGDLLLGLLSIVGWLAWAHVALTIASELVLSLTRHRVAIPVPGSRWLRPVAGALVTALAGLVLASALRSSDPGPVADPPRSAAPVPAAVATAPSTPAVAPPAHAAEPSAAGTTSTRARPVAPGGAPSPAPDPAVAAAAAPTATARPASPDDDAPGVYVVQSGDDLWTLAVTLYGDGLRWRGLASANRLDTDQPLLPGTVLAVPRLSQAEVSRLTGQSPVDRSDREVVVRRGDTLAGLAGRHLGSPAYWPAIQRENPTLILDPDHLEPGWVLRLPPRLVVPAPVARTSSASARTDATGPVSSPDPASAVDSAADPARTSVPLESLTRAGTTLHDGPRLDVTPNAAGPGSDGGTAAVGVGTSGTRASGTGSSTGTGRADDTSATDTPAHKGPGVSAAEADETPDSGAARAVVAGLAVALLSGVGLTLARRRRAQLWARPLGRRVPQPDDRARLFHQALSQVAALSSPDVAPPRDPSTVVLGERTGPDGRTESVTVVLGELPSLRLVGPAELVVAAAGGIATGLGCAPWSEGMSVTAIGPGLTWLSGLDDPSLTVEAGLDEGLRRLGRMIDSDATESVRRRPCRVVLVDLTHLQAPGQRDLLARFERRFSLSSDVAAVWLCGSDPEFEPPVPGGRTMLLLSEERARLEPGAPDFTPNLVSEPARRALVELFDATGRADTQPAPWWASAEAVPPGFRVGQLPPRQAETTAARRDDAFPGLLTLLPSITHPREAAPTEAGLLPLRRRPDTNDLEDTVPRVPEFLATAAHPVLLLLGEVTLVGARGPRPSRAVKQCEEYCAWILEYPGRTAVTMTRSLLVAEGTRRSNMSRLRTWLGTDENGDDYLPDAYSGHIQLHPGITTDWEQLRLLISAGVDQATDDALVEALELVRGAPLADAAPGQWHWAEELRIDMASTVRDIGAVLAARALAVNDIELARWAAARALSAAPEDELLMALRVRTEHLAGNRPEVERLVLHITRQARLLGVDLSDDTVTALQEAMEGRARARRA